RAHRAVQEENTLCDRGVERADAIGVVPLESSHDFSARKVMISKCGVLRSTEVTSQKLARRPACSIRLDNFFGVKPSLACPKAFTWARWRCFLSVAPTSRPPDTIVRAASESACSGRSL